MSIYLVLRAFTSQCFISICCHIS